MFSYFRKSNHQPSSNSYLKNSKKSIQVFFSRFIFSPATVALSLIFVLSWSSGWGQTNPTVHSLSTSNFSFTGFAAGTTTTYPTSVQGHKFPSERTTTNYTDNADGDRVLAVSTDATGTGSIRNEVANGFSLLNSGSNHIGAILIAVNSTGRNNLTVSWTAQQLNSGSSGATDRINGLSLQYRIGSTGSFTNVSSTEYLTTNTTSQNSAQSFSNIALPSACNNEAVVHLRWVYYISSGTTNARDRIRLDDITISSSASATPTISTTGTLSSVNTTYGTASTNTSFNVSGANMSAGILVTPPAGFEVSTSTSSGFATSITVGAAGTIASTPVYVRLAATTAVASYSGNIVLSSSGATSVNVATVSSSVSAKALTVTASAQTKTEGSTSPTTGTLNTHFTVSGLVNGNTANQATLAYSGSPAGNLATATPGSYTITPSALTLSSGITSNYSITYNTGTLTVNAAATPTLSSNSLTAFGSVCINTTAGPNSFTITGASLTAANVTVASLTGYTFSTTVGGTYTSTLSLTQPGGAYSQTIYVKFTPTSATSFSGNIVVGGGGASNVNVAASGDGTSGTVAVTTTTASSITTTTASTGGTAVSSTCGTITAKGVAYGTSANPTTPTTSNGTGTADFTSSLSGLTANTVYNYRSYATNSNAITNYGSNLTFTTLHNAPTVGSGSGATQTAINANWTAPAGGGSATFTYEVAISTAADFSSTLATQSSISSATLTYQFTGLTAGTTYYFRVRAVNAGGNSAWSATSAGYATLTDAISLTALGTTATENFNTLSNSGTSSTMPTGWFFSEAGSNANTTYTAGTGSDNAGNTYSFGSGSERALGGLRSGSLTPTIGAKITNGTGSTINNLFVNYTGETWRVGSSSRSDRLDFQYSLNATSLTSGTWVDFNLLDYANPGQAAGSGSLQHSSPISNVITGLTIANGSTFWIRWTDFDPSGANDGMAVDDISIKPCGTVSAPTASAQGFCSSASATVASLVATGTAIQWYSASTGGTALGTGTALATGTYYASQTLSGCESVTRTSVAVTITTAPNAGTLSGTQAVCSNGSTTFSSTGDAGSWTSGSTGVVTINASTGAITPVAAGTSTITYTVIGTGGCSNATATRTVTVTTAPNAGTLSGTQAVCSNGSTAFTSNGDAGSWTSGSTEVATINSSTGEITPVAAGTSTITYTVTGTGGCSNATATRTVTVTGNPTSPTASAQSFCSADLPTISDLVATGSAIQWYSASTGGSSLTTSTALSTGTYYATQTVTSCESATRTSVSVTINSNGTWIGGSTGDWNDINNWCGAIPNSNSTVVSIPSDVVIDLDFPVSVLDVTIGTNSTLNAGSNTITIADGGSFTNNGIFNTGTGTLSFLGNGSIGGSATTFNNLTINGALSINTSPTVNGTVTINADGSVIANPLIYGSSSTLVYNKGANLTTTNFEWPTSNSPRNVTVQNNSNLTLNGSKTILGTLTMNADINTGANSITLGNSSSVPGTLTYNSGKIIGELRRYFENSSGTNYIFPVGNASYKRGVTINFTEEPGENQYLTVAYRSGEPVLAGQTQALYSGLPFTTADGQLIQNYSNEGYWEINPTAYGQNIDIKNYQITFEMNNIGGVNDYTKTRLIRAKGPSHTTWQALTHISSIGSNSNYSITASGNGFSWFAGGGDDNNNPLPVELLSFTANCENDQTQLIWKTASENNSDYFEILKSQDGENWRVIIKQSAAGFSSILQTYSFVENEKSIEEAYYRLNQVDFNGDNKLYDPIFVDCDGKANQFISYPNPSKTGFNIAINDSKFVGESKLIIRDAMGKVVLTKSIEIVEGINLFPIEANEIENGVYFIVIENDKGQSKVIKQTIN